MTKLFRITPRAAQDLKDIAHYTLRTWGKEQRNTYLCAMNHRLAWLAEHPELGKHRTDIREGYYSYPQGSHIIFYMLSDEGIDIIAVLHQKMDIVSHFSAGTEQQD